MDELIYDSVLACHAGDPYSMVSVPISSVTYKHSDF